MRELIKILLDHPQVVSAFVALCAFFISTLSLLLTATSLYFLRTHQYRSVRPIASIPVADYEDNVAVMVKNTGIGPCRISEFRTTDGTNTEDDLISWMPALPQGISWKTFYADLDGAWIPAGEKLIVLQLTGDPGDPSFHLARDSCRRVLAKLTVSIVYEDIYGRRMRDAQKSLAWYGRHFETDAAPVSKRRYQT